MSASPSAALPRLQNFVGGVFVDAAGGAWLEDVDPATGLAAALIPRSGAADVETSGTERKSPTFRP